MKRVFVSVVMVVGLLGLLGMAARPPLVGGPAPEITLKDLQGQDVRLSDLRGKIVLLNFWATWCKPCKEEMPAMQASYEKLRDQGFVVLAVNELEDTDRVIEHIRTHGHTFPVVMDHDNHVANRYGGRATGQFHRGPPGHRAGTHLRQPADRGTDRRPSPPLRRGRRLPASLIAMPRG